MFQRSGTFLRKPSLDNIQHFCAYLGNPQEKFASIHIAGTNGKGSTAHMLAAIWQAAGYKTGLYTSPHLKSLTERIRINGQEIFPQEVLSFVNQHLDFIHSHTFSFFEITVAMAFDCFAQQAVDIAMVEVGMGGRLDSTNIVQPLLSLITNISYDHQQFLGDTLTEIASEKAGIIKANTPVVISEYQEETAPVFRQKAQEMDSPIYFAEHHFQLTPLENQLSYNIYYQGEPFLSELRPALKGGYQQKNLLGVLTATEVLKVSFPKIQLTSIRTGIENTTELTHLQGRWQILGEQPLIICDTAHNEGALRLVIKALEEMKAPQIYFITALSRDKDIKKILALYPSQAFYYFCQYNAPRALEAQTLASYAENQGLQGEICPSVNEALAKAQARAQREDIIFIGGSIFLISEIDTI